MAISMRPTAAPLGNTFAPVPFAATQLSPPFVDLYTPLAAPLGPPYLLKAFSPGSSYLKKTLSW